MQKIFEIEGSIEEYVEKGRKYQFPPPPFESCHNCKKMVRFGKHGFYDRYSILETFSGNVVCRRYICPLCNRTISYLPSFCLPGFTYGVKEIWRCLKEIILSYGTLKACLNKLNDIYVRLNISRQLAYHYKKRFMKNLILIQIVLRQMNSRIELPEENVSLRERAKKLVEIIRESPKAICSISQEFYALSNKTFLTLSN
ncbi:MAG: hypothetical protein LR001_00375 [Clostridiales bacterium]|nr:hypothetical protein [Clostridiales bacterium]